MYIFTINCKTVSVFSSDELGIPICLNPFSDEGQKVFEAAQTTGCPAFTLVAISDLDRNYDMVPWDSSHIFKNDEPCTSGTDNNLRLLTEKIIPTAEKEINGVPRWRGIAGYSLAGLFSLYTILPDEPVFPCRKYVRPLWFRGIKEYFFSHEPKRCPDCMYFSLGDKASKTQNPILRSVRQDTKEFKAFYQGKGINTVF